MFTGIIQHLGRIQSVSSKGEGVQVVIESPMVCTDLKQGDSVSVDGVCSTALAITSTTFCVDYLKETLDKTTIGMIKEGQRVNLELSATPVSRLGGHVMTGHVDDRGVVRAIHHRDPWAEVEIGFSPRYAPYLVPKGSIGLHGISLTPVDVGADYFTVHLIPETLANTVIQFWKVGDFVNLEFDHLAKYIDKILQHRLNHGKDQGDI